MYQLLFLPKISTVLFILSVPIKLFEEDGPLLTFRLSVVTLPLPMDLGFDKVVVSKLDTLGKDLPKEPPIL